MAKETVTRLIDDLDGKEAHETVRFALDGRDYEIDLSNKNANQLRMALGPYVDSGQKVGSRRGQSKPNAPTQMQDRERNRTIREWALKKKMDVAPRGRIAQEVIDAYNAAH